MDRRFQTALRTGVLVLLATPGLAVEITTCGQIVPPFETGVLTADLDCSASDLPFSVTLRREATLDLRGHTLTGPTAGENSTSAAAVRCDPAEETCVASRCTTYCLDSNKPCIVTSSMGVGSIIGSTGIVADRSLVASNLRVTAADMGIALGYRGRLRASNSVFDGGQGYSIRAESLSLCGDVYRGGNLKLDGITIIGGGLVGAHKGKVTARDIEIRNNVGAGIAADTVKLTRATIQDNGSMGVLAKRMRLSDSVVTGNLYRGAPLDLATRWDGSMPSLSRTTCDSSGKFDYESDLVGTWGICTND